MTFREDIERVINCHSRENKSDTPDYVLSQYLCDCLAAYDRAVLARAASRNAKALALSCTNGVATPASKPLS